MELYFLWLAAILALLGFVLGHTENTAYHLSQDQNHLLTPLDLHLPLNFEPHSYGPIKIKRKIVRRYKKRGSSQEDHENSSHLEQSESSDDNTEENGTKEQTFENLDEHRKHFGTSNEESHVQTQNSIITIDPKHALDRNSVEINERIPVLPLENRRSIETHSLESKDPNPYIHSVIYKSFGPTKHFVHNFEGDKELHQFLPVNNDQHFSEHTSFLESQNSSPNLKSLIHRPSVQTQHLPHKTEEHHMYIQKHSSLPSQLARSLEIQEQKPTQTLEIHKVFHQNHHLPHDSEVNDEFNVQLPFNSQSQSVSHSQVLRHKESQAQHPTQTLEIHKVFHQNDHLPHSSEGNDELNLQLPFNSQSQSFSHSQMLRHEESKAQNPTQTLEIHKVLHQNHHLPHSSEGNDEFNVQLPFNGHHKTFSETHVLRNKESQEQNPIQTLEYYKQFGTQNQLPQNSEGSNDVQVQMSSVSHVLPHSKESQEENRIQKIELLSRDTNSDSVVDVHLPHEITFDDPNQSLRPENLQLNIISPIEFDNTFDKNERDSEGTDRLRFHGFNNQPGSFDNLNCAALKFKLQMLFKSLYPYLDPRTPHPHPDVLKKLLGLVQLYLNLSKYYDFGRMTQQQILYILYYYATYTNAIQTAENGQIRVTSNSQVSIHNFRNPGRLGPDLPSIDASESNPQFLEGLITYFTQIGLLPNVNDGRLPQELVHKCKDVYSRRFLLRLKSAVSEYANSFKTCANYFVGHTQLTQQLGNVFEHVVPDQVGFVSE